MIRVWFDSGQYTASSCDNALDAVAEALRNPWINGKVVAVTHGVDPAVSMLELGFR